VIGIRAARPEDAAAIAAIYAPYVLTGTVSFETEPPDTRAMRHRMEASDGFYPWLVATNGDDEGGVLAYAYASKFRDRPAYAYVVETSIYVAGPVQGQGMGRLLYEALIDTLRAQGFTQAIGAIALPTIIRSRCTKRPAFAAPASTARSATSRAAGSMSASGNAN
jgi:phosphinothricin acetyltransferase